MGKMRQMRQSGKGIHERQGRSGQVRGYLLLEALLTLGLLAVLVTVVLGALGKSQAELRADQARTEALNVADMMLQTGRDQLTANGHEVELVKNGSEELSVEDENVAGEKTEILRLELEN